MQTLRMILIFYILQEYIYFSRTFEKQLNIHCVLFLNEYKIHAVTKILEYFSSC